MCKRTGVRQSLLSHGKNRDLCVLEGVMGYYDGIAGISKEASAWDVADTTDTPAILILDCKGVSVSAVAVVKGFLEYETEHHIKGVILNRISPMMYARMKQMIEEQLKTAASDYSYDGGLKAVISVPMGIQIAKKTFNPRLGIEGGISILGTTGIVEPMSEQALIDTISVELDVRKAQNEEFIIVTPGNYGQDFLRDNLGIAFDK